MRLIGLIVGGSLAVAVIAEGAYIVHTRRQVEQLSSRLEALGSEARRPAGSGDSGRFRPRRSLDEEDASETRRPARRRARPAAPAAGRAAHRGGRSRRRTSNDPLPLPPAIDTPEGREQLRRFVVAQLEQEREQGRQRQEQRQEEREQARRQRHGQGARPFAGRDREVQPDPDPDPDGAGQPAQPDRARRAEPRGDRARDGDHARGDRQADARACSATTG